MYTTNSGWGRLWYRQKHAAFEKRQDIESPKPEAYDYSFDYTYGYSGE